MAIKKQSFKLAICFIIINNVYLPTIIYIL